jgi:magnesium chelatase subunit I
VQPNTQSQSVTASAPLQIATVGELRASGHQLRSVKEEMRENLLTAMRAGDDAFPGIIGFGQTVLPHLERAIIAGHDVILLGERGQGKTRLIRTLILLLDEWTPAIAGCEINDHPFAPVCARCRRLAAEQGEDLAVSWRHRGDRYGEKLATPDTSVGDLVGDIDPVKVAEGRTLGDPETIHFGLVPRTNRGIFCLNELPDLAERIQVALLNVLEERDIGVRGYALRLPLDLVLVASANPEDYTSRGRIITPLKDRFGAEIRTHYPISLEAELALIRQEAQLAWGGQQPGAVLPDHLIQVIARFTRLVRASPAVDSRSGVSARFAIAAAEAVAASAVRRAAISGEDQAVARVCDLPATISTLRGKVEFEVSEEGREQEVLDHLLRRATAETFRGALGNADMTGLLAKFAEGGAVETGDLLAAADLLRRIGEVPGLAKIMERLHMDGGESLGQAAAALEFALEGLYLMRRLSKDSIDGGAVYRT